MNMKLFKMVFNRALRVKSRDLKQGSRMYTYLLARLERMLGTQDTYYAASLYFELVRTANSTGDNELAIEYLEKGRKILADHHGGPQSPNYIDYYLRKVELYVNLVMDQASESKNSTEQKSTP